jgi:flagellar biosynthesis/type III secretory pathway M-ring protein FliF/YscJ
MNRLNLLFFALLISLMHNYYSEFNTIFLQSFFFLFLFEFIIVKILNRFKRNQQNQNNQTDDSSDSDITEDENKESEEKKDTENTEIKETENTENTENKVEEDCKKEESSEETEEESDSESRDSSDEPVDITEGVDVNQMEILRLLNNYESLGDNGLMELKNKMLELDKLVEFYKNDTKKAKKE